MDSLLPLIVHVLDLHERAVAGDPEAVAEAEAMAGMLGARYGESGPVPGSVAAC